LGDGEKGFAGAGGHGEEQFAAASNDGLLGGEDAAALVVAKL